MQWDWSAGYSSYAEPQCHGSHRKTHFWPNYPMVCWDSHMTFFPLAIWKQHTTVQTIQIHFKVRYHTLYMIKSTCIRFSVYHTTYAYCDIPSKSNVQMSVFAHYLYNDFPKYRIMSLVSRKPHFTGLVLCFLSSLPYSSQLSRALEMVVWYTFTALSATVTRSEWLLATLWLPSPDSVLI